MLCAEVNIIFHSAATVRFNERLKVAARVNAVATWNLLEMCKDMPLLKVGFGKLGKNTIITVFILEFCLCIYGLL